MALYALVSAGRTDRLVRMGHLPSLWVQIMNYREALFALMLIHLELIDMGDF